MYFSFGNIFHSGMNYYIHAQKRCNVSINYYSALHIFVYYIIPYNIYKKVNIIHNVEYLSYSFN